MRRSDVFNRRNAVMGYIAWRGWKKVLTMKARSSVPSLDRATKRPNKSAIALLVAVPVAVLTFKRKRTGGEPDAVDS